MATTKQSKIKENAKALRANEKKWGKTLMDAGWTAFPSVILERQKALGLEPIEVNIILQLARYWWEADNVPYPSKKTLAECIGRHPRTIQKHIARLEKLNFIRREERRIKGGGSQTNRYYFTGLIEAVEPFARDIVEEKKKRKKEKEKRVAKVGQPKLEVVK